MNPQRVKTAAEYENDLFEQLMNAITDSLIEVIAMKERGTRHFHHHTHNDFKSKAKI